MTTTQTDALGRQTERTVNALGKVAQVKDPLNGVITYTYDAYGMPWWLWRVSKS